MYLWLWCKVLVFLLTCVFVFVLLFVLMLTGHCMKNGLLYFCAYDVKYFCCGDFWYFFVILSLCVYVDGVSIEKKVVLLCVCGTKYFCF